MECVFILRGDLRSMKIKKQKCSAKSRKCDLPEMQTRNSGYVGLFERRIKHGTNISEEIFATTQQMWTNFAVNQWVLNSYKK